MVITNLVSDRKLQLITGFYPDFNLGLKLLMICLFFLPVLGLLPTVAHARQCPEERRVTKVCREIGGGNTSEPPHCIGDTVRIDSSLGWVCREDGGSPRVKDCRSCSDFKIKDFQWLSPLTREKILVRAKAWVENRIRYSQRRFGSIQSSGNVISPHAYTPVLSHIECKHEATSDFLINLCHTYREGTIAVMGSRVK